MRNYAVLSLVIIFLLLASLVGASACAKPAPTPTPAPAPQPTPKTTPEPTPTTAPFEVEISGFAFLPPTITVAAGTTVTWTNLDAARHTVTSETGLFDSGNLVRNASFSHSFTDRGRFSYYCTIHPSMRGEVIVE